MWGKDNNGAWKECLTNREFGCLFLNRLKILDKLHLNLKKKNLSKASDEKNTRISDVMMKCHFFPEATMTCATAVIYHHTQIFRWRPKEIFPIFVPFRVVVPNSISTMSICTSVYHFMWYVTLVSIPPRYGYRYCVKTVGFLFLKVLPFPSEIHILSPLRVERSYSDLSSAIQKFKLQSLFETPPLLFLTLNLR